MNPGMRFEGGEQLARNLAQLPPRVSKKVLVQALMAGGAPMQVAMARNAPRGDPKAPNLADEIGMNAVRSDQQAAVAVGPTKNAFYGFFQEVGTAHHAAQPFARPAFDGEQQKALGLISDSLWRAMIARGFSSRIGQGSSESVGHLRAPRVSGGPGGGLL